jgi:hypothetical protein
MYSLGPLHGGKPFNSSPEKLIHVIPHFTGMVYVTLTRNEFSTAEPDQSL